MRRGRRSARARGVGRVRRGYDRLAHRYDRRWRRYVAESHELLRPFLAAGPPGRLLDLGAGTGALRRCLAAWGSEPAGYVSLDLSAGMLRSAEGGARPGGPRGDGPDASVQGDMSELPFREAAFDTVVSASALHFVPDPRRALDEARRVLRPGGALLLVDWCGDGPLLRLLDLWERALLRRPGRVLTRTALRSLLEGVGLEVATIERGRAWPRWPMMVAVGRRPADGARAGSAMPPG